MLAGSSCAERLSMIFPTISIRWLVLGLVVLAVSVRAEEKGPSNLAKKTMDYEQVIERLQKAVQAEVEAKRLPAFSIAIVDGDRTVWAEGFGYQDAARKTKATADTI
jgi:CubicO group peptidase (beta-lactamase class C family)